MTDIDEGTKSRHQARSQPQAKVDPPPDPGMEKTELTIRKIRRWMGFGVETAIGAGLLGAGIHDLYDPTHMVIAALPSWQVALAGLPMLGAGQSVVQVLRNLFGSKGGH